MSNSAVTQSQPVYVLGAGFSKAISPHMPVTDELGQLIRDRLRGVVDLTQLSKVSFEEWLSLRVTSLPFLERHENARRFADAQRVIAEVAKIIDERADVSASDEAPKWLQQLLAIWHMERALIVTFNYDTLLERAINSSRIVRVNAGEADVLFSDDLVHPSPVPPPAVTFADQDGSHADSFQILKAHGSTNWYWSSGDPTGSTLVRKRERSTFQGGSLYSGDIDAAGIGMLDRFLIPPVTSKSDFYSSALTQILWRSAAAGIRNTTRLALLGYSMPPADGTTVELLRGLGDDASVDLVDRSPNAVSSVGTLADRARSLAPTARIWEGDQCMAEYVSDRLQDLAASFAAGLQALGDELDATNVVIALPQGSGLNAVGIYCVLGQRDGELTPVEIFMAALRSENTSPIEAVLSIQPPSSWNSNDLLTVGKLRSIAAKGNGVVVRHSSGSLVVVGFENIVLYGSEALYLHLAPT